MCLTNNIYEINTFFDKRVQDRENANLAITLMGPGGAGKSTVALRLAERLRIRAVDLDRLFAECAGDISEYINRFGYDVYARQNVETYRLMLQEGTEGTVVRYHQDS